MEYKEPITMKNRHSFLTDFIQHGRRKPKKYKHYIKIPVFLYDELIDKGVIILEDLYIDGCAYFEFTELFATINFISYWQVEDVHIRILDYLVRKHSGDKSPIERGGNMF